MNHIHVWQVPPQLSYWDTCQIWTWYSICNQCLDKGESGENNGTGEIALVTPMLAVCPLQTHHYPVRCRNVQPCGQTVWLMSRMDGSWISTSGGRFNNAHELLNLRALKLLPVNEIHISLCMGKIFCEAPLKFHTKYLTYTLKDYIFIQRCNFKSS